MGLADNAKLDDLFKTHPNWDPGLRLKLANLGINQMNDFPNERTVKDILNQVSAPVDMQEVILTNWQTSSGNGAQDSNAPGGDSRPATEGPRETAPNQTSAPNQPSVPGGTQGGPAKPPALPRIPKGTLIDLSSDDPIVIDRQSWPQLTEPSALPVTGDYVEADQLTDWDWIALARRSGLLRGLRMDQVFAGKDAQASRLALRWKVASGFYLQDDQSGEKHTVDFTAQEQSFRNAACFSAQVGGGYAYCSASVEASYASAEAASAHRSTLYITARHEIRRVKVFLDQCTELAPEFVDRLRAVVADSQADRFARLSEVFDEYGHVYYPEVVLGGTKFGNFTRVQTSEAEQAETLIQVKAAAKYAAGGTTAEAGASAEAMAASSAKVANLYEETSWTTIGGNTLNSGGGQEVAGWKAALAQPKGWRIIDRIGEPRPLLDLLTKSDAKLKEDVEAIWRDGLRQMWNVKADEQVPFKKAVPHFHNRLVMLISSETANKRQALGAYKNQVSHSNAALAKPYPPRKDYSLTASPQGYNLEWKFVFAGIHDNGTPIYLVLTQDEEWALTTVREGGSTANLVLTLTSGKAALDKAAQGTPDHNTCWLVHRADAGGFYRNDQLYRPLAKEWLLQQWSSKWYLGPTETWSDGLVRTTLKDVGARVKLGKLVPGDKHPYSLTEYGWEIRETRRIP